MFQYHCYTKLVDFLHSSELNGLFNALLLVVECVYLLGLLFIIILLILCEFDHELLLVSSFNHYHSFNFHG